MSSAAEIAAEIIEIRGLVQGVGFRPFVYRTATELGIRGRVRNESGCVRIRAEGTTEDLGYFRRALRDAAPPTSFIEQMLRRWTEPSGLTSFEIEPSVPCGNAGMRVPHDLATCERCLGELLDPANHRHAYPFTTCTDCGPRYSSIEQLPYDRPLTTMRHFALCSRCQAEYLSPADRRFHAETNSCPGCGPRVAFWEPDGAVVAFDSQAIATAVSIIRDGRIIALKGLGGFQLLVRADRSSAVARLRERKRRLTKPFAVMVANLDAARKLGRISPEEARLLLSPENPIVLLDRNANAPQIADEVAPHVRTIGVFLPTTPLHHLILAQVDFPLIVTSGNLGDEPIVIDGHEALTALGNLADGFLTHDRPIAQRVDDSVVRVISGSPVTLRLGRGLAPLALPAIENQAVRGLESPPAIVALGGHQKVAIAFWNGAQAVLSQHLGDLDGFAARSHFANVVRGLPRLYGFQPAAYACDLHPDYHTSRWAGDQELPTYRVQHHHAHAVAAMVEHDLLEREVTALTWDGSGYGPDGTVWGGEVLIARIDGYSRVASLLPFPLPGGEAAVRQPRRVALMLLAQALGEAETLAAPFWLDRIGMTRSDARSLLSLARSGMHSPRTSSLGRLFDGVAALVLGADAGIVSHEGEAAAWLEATASPDDQGSYALPTEQADRLIGDWRTLISALVADVQGGESVQVIASRFHAAIAEWGASVARSQGPLDVVLSGGCFQNRLLTERTAEAIHATGKRAYPPGRIPTGDGGLAVGQLAVALKMANTSLASAAPNSHPQA